MNTVNQQWSCAWHTRVSNQKDNCSTRGNANISLLEDNVTEGLRIIKSLQSEHRIRRMTTREGRLLKAPLPWGQLFEGSGRDTSSTPYGSVAR